MKLADGIWQWLRRKMHSEEIPCMKWSSRRQGLGEAGHTGATEPGKWLQRTASDPPGFDYALKRKVLLELRKKVKKKRCGQ